MKDRKVNFWEVAENWYQRTHKLRAVWQNERETPERTEKAFRLWEIMASRVLKCSEIHREARTKRDARLFKGGEFPSGGVHDLKTDQPI